MALATVLIASLVVVAEPAKAAFPGSTGSIAFQSISSGQISRMNADGFGPAQLTDTGSNYAPAWSADGTKLAFTSDRDDNFNN